MTTNRRLEIEAAKALAKCFELMRQAGHELPHTAEITEDVVRYLPMGLAATDAFLELNYLLSDKFYLENGGGFCPNCFSENIIELSDEESKFTRDYHCPDCDTKWTERFMLGGIDRSA